MYHHAPIHAEHAFTSKPFSPYPHKPTRVVMLTTTPTRCAKSVPNVRTTTKRARAPMPRSVGIVCASANDKNDESIEALEARLKSKRNQPTTSTATASASSNRPTNASGNPAFGYLDTAAKRNRVRAGANGSLAAWEQDPAAWEETPAMERAWTVWTGEKGWMYWMNQASLYGAGALAFFWVLFRFIGPAIGLYTLN